MMCPNWNLEELEYWKIATYTHFSLRGKLLNASTSYFYTKKTTNQIKSVYLPYK